MFNLGIVSVCLGHITGNLSLMSLTSSPLVETQIGVAVDLFSHFVRCPWARFPSKTQTSGRGGDTHVPFFIPLFLRPAVASLDLSFPSFSWRGEVTSLLSFPLNQGTFRNLSHLLLRDGAGICVVH